MQKAEHHTQDALRIPRAAIGQPSAALVKPLFTVTIFLSAFLLFSVQPMFASMALPLLGGSPAVWNTASAFYQIALLAGYCYAHLMQRHAPLKPQLAMHLVIALLPVLVLPIAIPAGSHPAADQSQTLWLIGVLAVSLGLPYFVISTTNPLLQSWFARTKQDAYPLYIASNAGSLIALLAYPALIQPFTRTSQQPLFWTAGYALYIVLLVSCAVVTWRRREAPVNATAAAASPAPRALAPPTWGKRLNWIVLSLIPSSLLLSVTTFITTDITSLPLLWVIPLALYLLTFVIAFGRRPAWLRRDISLYGGAAIGCIALLHAIQRSDPAFLMLPLHLVAFFVIALWLHGQLADSRPDQSQLTEFYFWMSLGGAIGGSFNAFAAPLIFSTTAEYPLMIGVAAICVSLPLFRKLKPLDWIIPVAGAAASCGLIIGGRQLLSGNAAQWIWVAPATVCALVWVFGLVRKPAFGLSIAVSIITGFAIFAGRSNTLETVRSFFGINRVVLTSDGRMELYHGTTLHGLQRTEAGQECVPQTYYTTSGPAGDALALVRSRSAALQAGVIGLGSGALASYAKPADAWTFIEIDPAVERIARNPKYFTYLSKCAPDAKVIIGDGRLELKRFADHSLDILMVDAYSSDAVPLHLTSREALQLYLQKLKPSGVLALHISNRFFDLRPIWGNLAKDAGADAMVRFDDKVTEAEFKNGKTASMWVTMSPDHAALKTLASVKGWVPLTPDPSKALWTDDFANPLSVLQ